MSAALLSQLAVSHLTSGLQPAASTPDPLAIHSPSIEYRALAPMLIVFGAATVGVIFEAFLPRRSRPFAQTTLALAGLVAAFVAVVLNAGIGHLRRIVVEGAVAMDGPALFIQGTILAVSIGGLLLIADRSLDDDGDFVAQAADVPGSADERASVRAGFTHTEVFPLAMFAVAGMLLFSSADDLITMFVALEVLSLPLYLLVGMARRRRLLSQEAAVKYFLLGAFSSAFFVYGLAMVYGFADTVQFSGIADALTSSSRGDSLILLGVALIGIALLFKLSGAPFHWWTPDVYQGAPTSVTAFMAAGTKIAAFGALMRVFFVAFGGLSWDWRPVMWAIAIITMSVGAIVGVTQTDVKRLLAYSSIAHAGFILTAVAALAPASARDSLSGVEFYLVAYGFMTIGSFAIVMLVRDGDGEANHLSRWVGLGRDRLWWRASLLSSCWRWPGCLAPVVCGRRWPCSRPPARAARGPGGRRGHSQCHHRLLLRPHHRADVLPRAAPRRPDRGPAAVLHLDCHRARPCGYRGAWRGSAATAQPRR